MLRKLTTLIIWTVLSVVSLTGASRWKEVTIPQPFAQFAFLDFADSLDGVLFSKSGVYARTTDGGKTWILDSASFAGEVTNVKYFGKGHCWIQTDSANYPSLFYSSDGKVWVQRRLPDSLRYMGPSCGFATEQKILINTGKAILGTSNGGVTWAKKYQAYGARHSIDFADSTTGIATFSNIGASGETYWCLTLRTTDGGSTWDTLKAGYTAYNDVHFYTPMRGTMRWDETSMEAMWFRTGMAFTTDGGKSFHDLQTAATGAEDRLFPVSGVEFDASNKFIIAEDSRIKTGEGGILFSCSQRCCGDHYSLVPIPVRAIELDPCIGEQTVSERRRSYRGEFSERSSDRFCNAARSKLSQSFQPIDDDFIQPSIEIVCFLENI